MYESLLIPRREIQVVTVGGPDADISGFNSNAIIMAVEVLKCRGGGMIKLNKGVFDIIAPVRLYDNIVLTGMGEETVLRKGGGFETGFDIDVDAGEIKAVVRDASGFRAGMGVQVTDAENSNYWRFDNPVITAVEGNTIYFDRYIIETHISEKNGTISNSCSVIETEGAQNVKILDLAIDGNKDKNKFTNRSKGAGIYLRKSCKCAIENVKVFNCNCDGICWGTTEDITVRNCEAEGCAVFGLHAGGGSVRTVVEGCNVHDNGRDGIYVCWRVQGGLFRNNRTYNNRANGISIGHKDTDNCFEANHIYGNGFSGVFIRDDSGNNGAHRNSYKKNVIEDNGRDGEGYGIFFNGETDGNVIKENIIRDTGKKRQRIGILVQGEPLKVRIKDNEMSGHLEGDIVNKMISKNKSTEV